MIPRDDQPRACGFAAQPREVLRGSRSNIPLREIIVILAAAALPAAAIDDRFHMDCAKVAPSIQFLQTGTSIFSTNDGVVSSASGLAPRRRQSSVASALAPRRGQAASAHLQLNLYSFEFFDNFFIHCRPRFYHPGVYCNLRHGTDFPFVEDFAELLRR